MRLGISTWSLGTGTIEALQLISRVNIRYIELWYYDDLRKFKREISEFMNSHDITPWSLHAPFGKELDISHLNESIRKKSLREVLKSMDIAHFYGCRCLVVHPSSNFYSDIKHYEDSKRALMESLSELERHAARLGIRVLLENMLSKIGLYRIGVTVKELLEVIVEGGFEYTGICLDTGHSNYNGLNPSEEALIAGSYLGSIHFNDNDGTSDSHKVPCEGTINWDDFFKALRRLNYKEVLILEVYGGSDPKSVVERSFIAAMKLLGT